MLNPGAAARPPARPATLLPRPCRKVQSALPAVEPARAASPTRRRRPGNGGGGGGGGAGATTSTPARPPPPLPDPSSELACPHFGACSGCVLQAGLADPPARAAAAAWFADRGAPLPPPAATAGPPHGWRTRARLAVRPPPAPWWDARPAVGLFVAGSHVVYDVVGGAGAGGGRSEGAGAGGGGGGRGPAPALPSPAATPCRAHHPRLNAAAAAVAEAAARLGTAIYSEPNGGRAPPKHKGGGRAGAPPPPPPPPPSPGLRYLQLTAVAPSPSAALAAPPHADPGAAVQAVLVWGGPRDGVGGGGPPPPPPPPSSSPPRPPPPPRSGPAALAAALWAAHGPGGTGLLHSVALNFQPAPGNAILGADWVAAAGTPDAAWQVAGAAAVAAPPAAFCQANPGGFGRLLADAGALLDGCGPLRALGRPLALADLFAGAGAVGLGLAARGLEAEGGGGGGGGGGGALAIGSVRAVDANAAGGPATAAGAAALADRWGAAAPTFDFVAARAGEAPTAWLAGVDAAVVDPPRKGLDPELLAALAGAGAGAAGAAAPPPPPPPPSLRALLYVACHFPSLARDGDALLQSGHWRLAGGAAHVLFPGADAVEAVALFERV